MGLFKIIEQPNGEFKYSLHAGNGQSILHSEGYTTQTACLNGIESVRRNSQADFKFEKQINSGKHYFILKVANGQVIGRSEMYESDAACENGIESVKKNAPDAEVKIEIGS